MTVNDAEQLQLRKTELERKLTARKRMPGYASNVAAIEAELARLDEEIASMASGSDGAHSQPSS